MKIHRTRQILATCWAAIAVLLGSCLPASSLECPQAGEVIPPPGPGEAYVSLTLENDSCMSVCVLLVSPNQCEYLGGENWVEGHPLRSGETVTRLLPPGRYTIWSELCTGEYIAEEDIRIVSDRTHLITDNKPGSSSPCGTSLTILNKADVPICNLRIGIGDSVYTGWNWLGDEVIQPGGSRTIALRPDTYFLRAEDCDAGWMRSDVDLKISGEETWAVP